MSKPHPLTNAFPWRSPLSIRPPDYTVRDDEILCQVETELARRSAPGGYARAVANPAGGMTAEQAAQHIAILAAIRDDLWERIHPGAANLARTMGLSPPPPAARQGPDFPWETKVREIRRELAIKRNSLPKKVASPTHPLGEPEAVRIFEAWDALHWQYWGLLDRFDGGEHQRFAWIAEREADRARGPDWHDRPGEFGASDPGHDWIVIAGIARAIAAGRHPLDATNPAALARLSRHASQRLAEALAASERTQLGTPEHALAEAQLILDPLERWLASLNRQFGPIERKEAA